MLIERAPRRVHAIPAWLRIAVMALLALVLVGIAVLATHWPFNRPAMTRAIEKATSRRVRIGAFHQSYFPPGCIAENVEVFPRHGAGPPLISIRKLLVQGSLTGMFTSPKRLGEVKVVGMRLRIPPKGKGGSPVALDSGSPSLAISKIVADGALLEFLPEEPGKKPYRLLVKGLAIKNAGSGGPMSYDAVLENSEPPGEIRSRGKFGPWNPDDPGLTPVWGVFSYTRVDLAVFRGIAGTLRAEGKFRGPLGHIQAEGSVEVPNFHVNGSGSAVRLSVGFQAIVNGTNGDTALQPAEAHFLRTAVEVHADIARHSAESAKTATLDLEVPAGRIEDILRLFISSKTAPLSGDVALRAKVLWPPGPEEFLKKIRLDIDFGIGRGRFASSKTQGSIDRLSESAQGESKKEEKDDPRTILSNLRGHAAIRGGVMSFSGVTVAVPGAEAKIHGDYNLMNYRVDLHGLLYTHGRISDATSGFKAVVVKLITPFLKRSHDMKVVPFKITGTFSDAQVSLD